MLADIIHSFKDIVFGPQLDERRNTARARSNFPLSCQTSKGALVARLRDLSESGARLLTDQRVGKGTVVILVPPKGMALDSKGTKAKVVWCRKIGADYQLGLKFQMKAERNDWVSELLRELGLRSTAPTQRRKHVRVTGKRSLTLTVRGTSHPAELEDLSAGGALLLVSERFALDTPVQLTINATAALPELQLVGKVKSCGSRKDGRVNLSLSFEAPSAVEQKALAKHLSDLMRASLRS